MVSHTDIGNARPQELAQSGLVVRDLLETLEAYARGMWRYRWRAVVIMWTVSIAGWVAVYAMPPVYGASARVFVDAENALRPLLQGNCDYFQCFERGQCGDKGNAKSPESGGSRPQY